MDENNQAVAVAHWAASTLVALQLWLTRGRQKVAMYTGASYLRQQWRTVRAEKAVRSFKIPRAASHSLPDPVIISLTSYPPRFPTLWKTIRSLLMQTVAADRVVLWIAHEDERYLPQSVLDEKEHGLEIMMCDDLRSYKKIIPALEAFPDTNIVIADDDLYYEPHWLETIIQGVVPGERVVICRRAHRPRLGANGFARYSAWKHDVLTGGKVVSCIFPTGCGGVLYPPHSLAPEVTDRAKFSSLCPTADDIWLFLMAWRAGTAFKQVGGGFAQISWAESQKVSLTAANLSGANDRQLEAALKHFHMDPESCEGRRLS